MTPRRTGLLRRNKNGARGFTLLEMMIALSILAISLTWLIEGSIRAVEAENHAKLMTTATFLARQVLVDLEDDLFDKGITDDALSGEKTGDFEEAGFKRFKWKRVVDKVELPGQAQLQTALGQAAGVGGSGSSGTSPIPGMGNIPGMGGSGGTMGGAAMGSANMFSNFFGVVKDVLEQGIRRVTVRVSWDERGEEKFVEVAEYVTDPRKVDQAIQLPTIPGGGPGPGGAPPNGTNPTGGTTPPSSAGPR